MKLKLVKESLILKEAGNEDPVKKHAGNRAKITLWVEDQFKNLNSKIYDFIPNGQKGFRINLKQPEFLVKINCSYDEKASKNSIMMKMTTTFWDRSAVDNPETISLKTLTKTSSTDMLKKIFSETVTNLISSYNAKDIIGESLTINEDNLIDKIKGAFKTIGNKITAVKDNIEDKITQNKEGKWENEIIVNNLKLAVNELNKNFDGFNPSHTYVKAQLDKSNTGIEIIFNFMEKEEITLVDSTYDIDEHGNLYIRTIKFLGDTDKKEYRPEDRLNIFKLIALIGKKFGLNVELPKEEKIKADTGASDKSAAEVDKNARKLQGSTRVIELSRKLSSETKKLLGLEENLNEAASKANFEEAIKKAKTAEEKDAIIELFIISPQGLNIAFEKFEGKALDAFMNFFKTPWANEHTEIWKKDWEVYKSLKLWKNKVTENRIKFFISVLVSTGGIDNIKNYLNENHKILLKTIDTYPYEDVCLIFANYIIRKDKNEDIFRLTLTPTPEAIKKACELAKIDYSEYLEKNGKLKADKFSDKLVSISTRQELQKKLLIDETHGVYRDIKTLDAIKNAVQKLNKDANKRDTDDETGSEKFKVSGSELNNFLNKNGVENSLDSISNEDVAKVLNSLLTNNKDNASKKAIISALFQLDKNKFKQK